MRVPEEFNERLEFLARSTKRSKAFFAVEAPGEYVKKNAWRARELRQAVGERRRDSAAPLFLQDRRPGAGNPKTLIGVSRLSAGCRPRRGTAFLICLNRR
jgi:hypothetical protein